MAGIRAFICIDIPDAVKDAMSKTIAQLKSDGIRLVAPENLHITLFFFESIDEKRLQSFTNIVKKLDWHSFNVSMSGVGIFDPKRPHVIFVNLNDDGVVTELYKELLPKLKEVGFTGEERPFSPHITIARVKEQDKDTLQKIAAFVEANKDVKFGDFECKEILLKQSTLTGSGPLYETLFSRRLM